jgi:hypothetical protein
MLSSHCRQTSPDIFLKLYDYLLILIVYVLLFDDVEIFVKLCRF